MGKRLSGRELQRFKRAEEIDLRDTVLRVADKALSGAQASLARAAVAAFTGRDVSKLVDEATTIIKQARTMLRVYYDHK